MEGSLPTPIGVYGKGSNSGYLQTYFTPLTVKGIKLRRLATYMQGKRPYHCCLWSPRGEKIKPGLCLCLSFFVSLLLPSPWGLWGATTSLTAGRGRGRASQEVAQPRGFCTKLQFGPGLRPSRAQRPFEPRPQGDSVGQGLRVLPGLRRRAWSCEWFQALDFTTTFSVCFVCLFLLFCGGIILEEFLSHRNVQQNKKGGALTHTHLTC